MADNTNLPPPTLYLVDCNGLSVTFDKPMAEFPHARPLWSEEAVRALLARGSAAAPAAPASSEARDALLTDEMLEVGRLAIEDALVELRDSRIAVLGRGNGLVIRESDGSESSIIRFGPETALRIGIKAMLAAMAASKEPPRSFGADISTGTKP